jgi:hypothetical protein
MMYKANVVLCSETRTKHSKQSKKYVEFLISKETARPWKVKILNQVKVPMRDISNAIMHNGTTKFIANNELQVKFHSGLEVGARFPWRL